NDKYWRYANLRAPKSMTVTLTAGKTSALHADDRVTSVRERRDEVMRIGGRGRADDLFVGRVRPTVGDVLAHGCVEDQRLLEQERDVLAHGAHRQVAQILAVKSDHALGWVVTAE